MEMYIREVGQRDKKSGNVHWTLMDVLDKDGLLKMYFSYEPYVDCYCEDKIAYYIMEEGILSRVRDRYLADYQIYNNPFYKRWADECLYQKKGFEAKRNSIYCHKFTIYFSENLIRFRRIIVNDTHTNNEVDLINFDELFNKEGEMTL